MERVRSRSLRGRVLLDALAGLGSPGGAITTVLVGIVVVGCFVLFRRDAMRAVSTLHVL